MPAAFSRAGSPTPESCSSFGEDHLALGTDRLELAAPFDFDPDRAPAVEDDPADQHPRLQLQVRARKRWLQIGVGGRPAAPLGDRHLHRAEAFLLFTVVVGGHLVTCLAAGLHEGMVERVRARAAGHVQWAGAPAPVGLASGAAFHPLEVGQDLTIAPAGGAHLLPGVVIAGMPPDIDHAVDRRGAADDLPARASQAPAAEVRFRLGLVAPIVAGHVHGIGKRGRHLDEGSGVTAAELQDQNPVPAILAQAMGKGAPRGTGADDDVVGLSPIPSHHAASASCRRSFPFIATCFTLSLIRIGIFR